MGAQSDYNSTVLGLSLPSDIEIWTLMNHEDPVLRAYILNLPTQSAVEKVKVYHQQNKTTIPTPLAAWIGLQIVVVIMMMFLVIFSIKTSWGWHDIALPLTGLFLNGGVVAHDIFALKKGPNTYLERQTLLSFLSLFCLTRESFQSDILDTRFISIYS